MEGAEEDAEEGIQREEDETAESQLPPPAGPPAAFGPHAARAPPRSVSQRHRRRRQPAQEYWFDEAEPDRTGYEEVDVLRKASMLPSEASKSDTVEERTAQTRWRSSDTQAKLTDCPQGLH